MTVEEMLCRISSSEITDWAAFFSNRDEDDEKAQKDGKVGSGSSEREEEDLTSALIAAIDQDRMEG